MNTPNEMTLRDWFAGQAMEGWMAGRPTPAWNNEDLASASYRLADAMIAERERRAKVAAEKAKEAEREANQKAFEWVRDAGLKITPVIGGVCVMDGERVLGTGKDLVAAVADARAKLAADPAPLAPEAKPAPSTPDGEDDEAWATKWSIAISRTGWSKHWEACILFSKTEITATGPTIAEALRALRAKAEGGKA